MRAWAYCGLRYFTEDEVEVVVLFRRSMSCPVRMGCRRRVIIKIDRGFLYFLYFFICFGTSGNMASNMEGRRTELGSQAQAQGPSCLFSAAIEKPFSSSSRRVTTQFDVRVSRHDQHVLWSHMHNSPLLPLPNIPDIDISIIQGISYENTVSTRNLMLRKRAVQVEWCEEIDITRQLQQ